MKYSDQILKQFPEMWTKASEHPYIESLCSGTLPKDSFRDYVIQDYLICRAIRHLYALVLSKLPITVTTVHFEKLTKSLGSQVSPKVPELQALKLFHKELGVTDKELTSASLVTRAFTDFIISTGYTASYKQSLVVLFTMNFVYERWAERFSNYKPGDPLVQKWLDIHSDYKFGPTLDVLREAIDESKPHFTKVGKKHMDAVKTTLQLEISFWDSLGGKYQWAT